MYVQIVQGTTSDPESLIASLDRWTQDLAPGATGWLGATAGVTEDGRAIAMMRYESEEAARRNAERPEQAQWWADTEPLLEGGGTVRNSGDVTVEVHGDPDQAGFVQVMQGRGSDPDRARELMAQDSDKWAAHRPEVLGSVGVGHEGGAYTMFMYFTSEAEAREGEKKEIPPELQANMAEMNKLTVGQPEFFDLKQPLMRSAP